MPQTELCAQNALPLADRPVGNSSGGSSIGRARKSVAVELGFDSSEPIKGGLPAKMAKIAATADSVGKIHRYWALAGEANI